MRSLNMLKAAVAFVAIALVFVAAVPSAQAVGTYNRRLMSVNYTECMGFTRTIDPIGVNNGYCSWAEGRWRVHVKSDSYRGTGHEVWQIENATNPGSCMTAGNFSGATVYPGSCQYSGS